MGFISEKVWHFEVVIRFVQSKKNVTQWEEKFSRRTRRYARCMYELFDFSWLCIARKAWTQVTLTNTLSLLPRDFASYVKNDIVLEEAR